MQIMPETAGWAAEKMAKPDLSRRLTVPSSNLALGSWYYRYLLDKYRDERLALAAYNGGERNLDEWLKAHPDMGPAAVVEEIPYQETYDYVRAVLRTKKIYSLLYPELGR